jgi:hypothetical protein
MLTFEKNVFTSLNTQFLEDAVYAKWKTFEMDHFFQKDLKTSLK